MQEALTNVVRHAHADGCRVGIVYGRRELALEITDDGRGLPEDGPAGAGFGLTGMRERAALLNGRFEAGPLPAGASGWRRSCPSNSRSSRSRKPAAVREREEKR